MKSKPDVNEVFAISPLGVGRKIVAEALGERGERKGLRVLLRAGGS